MDQRSVIDQFVQLLVTRHELTGARATGVLRRAAERKGWTMHDLAASVVLGTPRPAVPPTAA